MLVCAHYVSPRTPPEKKREARPLPYQWLEQTRKTQARLLGISGLAEAVHVHGRGGLEAVDPPVHPPKRVQKRERGIGQIQDGVMEHLETQMYIRAENRTHNTK